MLVFPIPKETLRLWQWRAGFGAIPPGAVFLFFSAAVPWFLILLGVWCAFAAAVLFWYLPRYRRSCNLTIAENRLKIERGVFFHKTALLSLPRTVFADKVSSPLAAKMGVCALNLRSVRRSVRLPELEERNAERIFRRAAESMCRAE